MTVHLLRRQTVEEEKTLYLYNFVNISEQVEHFSNLKIWSLYFKISLNSIVQYTEVFKSGCIAEYSISHVPMFAAVYTQLAN